MKKTLLNACLMTIMGVGMAMAETFTIDGIDYQLLEDGSGVEIAANENYSGDIVVPATVKYGNITYKVVGMGEMAFTYSEITSVKLPNTIRIIKYRAFANCENLVSVDMGTGIEKIENLAFAKCSSLTTLSEIPATCVDIAMSDNGVFLNNEALKAINVAEDNPMYKSIDGVVYTKSGRTCIAYPYGHGEEFTFPEEVDSIGNNLMNTNKTMLKKITFPSQLKYVGRAAFTACYVMENTNDLPSTVETIGANAFGNCRKLNVTIPAGLKSMSFEAFKNCWALQEIYVPNTMELWGNSAFTTCSGVKKLTIEANPETVKTIAFNMFSGCTNLPEIIVPEGYEMLDQSAFGGCTAAKTVDLPSTMKSFSYDPFTNVAPEKIICRAATPPVSNTKTTAIFSKSCYTTATVYVPKESIDAYKEAAMWKNFTNYKALDELSGIEDITDSFEAEEVAKAYYNLQGVEVAAPAQADGKVYIVKTVYSNGKTSTTKVINR